MYQEIFAVLLSYCTHDRKFVPKNYILTCEKTYLLVACRWDLRCHCLLLYPRFHNLGNALLQADTQVREAISGSCRENADINNITWAQDRVHTLQKFSKLMKINVGVLFSYQRKCRNGLIAMMLLVFNRSQQCLTLRKNVPGHWTDNIESYSPQVQLWDRQYMCMGTDILIYKHLIAINIHINTSAATSRVKLGFQLA